MKDLIVQKINSNYLTVSEITEDFKGLIIGYDQGNLYCFIVYDPNESTWFACDEINLDTCIECEKSLIELLNKLKLTLIFKVIEF